MTDRPGVSGRKSQTGQATELFRVGTLGGPLHEEFGSVDDVAFGPDGSLGWNCGEGERASPTAREMDSRCWVFLPRRGGRVYAG
jgi:hypothetical protein